MGWVKKISKTQEVAPTHCRDKSATGISFCPGFPMVPGSVVGPGKRRGTEQNPEMRQIILVRDRGTWTRRTTSLLLLPRDEHLATASIMHWETWLQGELWEKSLSTSLQISKNARGNLQTKETLPAPCTGLVPREVRASPAHEPAAD